MTAPRRGSRARAEGDSPGPGGATARGALLIAAAVVVGVVLLGQGFSSGFLPSTSPTPTEQATGGDDEADEPDGGTDDGDDGTSTTDPATATTHPVNEVRVQVLNSSGPSGSAGTASAALAATGYVTLDAANAVDRNAPATAVFAAAGFEADAQAVATQLGIAAAPQPMPEPPPPPAPADAHVVVVLGPDFTPPG